MDRKKKDDFVQNIMDVFMNNNFLILVNFKFMSAGDLLTIRSDLRAIAGGGMLVVKNTLVRLALKKINKYSCLLDKFFGPVAVIYSSASTLVETLKLVVNFIDTNKRKMSLICVIYLNQLLSVEDINELVKLPSLGELRIKIIYLIVSCILVRLGLTIRLPFIKLARILDSYNSKNNLIVK
ncbi:MAG: 50S ribosomal protein L10 [Wolbachia endosymbiont of Menacanthus eurysternus]|nr:MAG: 50S ribosomal protein L10 [Wolbachia endosymbiont of Menacanthus eurysternus]